MCINKVKKLTALTIYGKKYLTKINVKLIGRFKTKKKTFINLVVEIQIFLLIFLNIEKLNITNN